MLTKPPRSSRIAIRLLVSRLLGLGSVGVVVGIGLLSLFWAYQQQTYVFDLYTASPDSASYLNGFSEPQHNDVNNFDYRWSTSESYVNLVYPSTPFEITFHAAALRPDDRPIEMQVIINGRETHLYALDNTPRDYTLRSRLISFGPQGLQIAFKPLSTFQTNSSDGPEEHGIALSWIEVRQATSRFGPALPPPFIIAWWLVLSLAPLGLVALSKQPFKLALMLTGGSFGLIDLLYANNRVTSFRLRTDWLPFGILLVVLQIIALLAVRWLGRESWAGKGFRVPVWVWLLSGVLLMYSTTFSGQFSSSQEMQQLALTYNMVHLQPTSPIDVLLPDPLPGEFNPPHLGHGLAQSLLSVPFYGISRVLARALPSLPSARIGDNGLTVYAMLVASLLTALAMAGSLYWLLRQQGWHARTAGLTVALCGIATTQWAMSDYFLSENLDGLALLWLVGGAWLYSRKRYWGWAALSGFCLGLLTADQTFNLFLLPVVLVYFYRTRRRPVVTEALPIRQSLPAAPTRLLLPPPSSSTALETLTFRPGTYRKPPSKRQWRVRWQTYFRWQKVDQGWLLPLAIPLLIWLVWLAWYNLSCFGALLSPTPIGETSLSLWDKFYQWLINPATSIFWHNPVLLLAFAAVVIWWAYERIFMKWVSAILIVALLSRWLFANGTTEGWQMLAPLLPLALWLVAPLVEWVLYGELGKWEKRFLTSSLVLFGASSFLMQVTDSSHLPIASGLYADTPLAFFTLDLQTALRLLLAAEILLFLLSWKHVPFQRFLKRNQEQLSTQAS